MKTVKIFANNGYYLIFINKVKYRFNGHVIWESLINLLLEHKIISKESEVKYTSSLKQAIQCQLEEEYPNLKNSYFCLRDDDVNFNPNNFEEIENYLKYVYKYKDSEKDDIEKFLKKNSIKISGSYGDKVKLFFDGYVSTKYGEFLRIKSVDQENEYVYLYGCGDDGVGYSRVSGSCKVSKDANEEYLSSLETMFKLLKLKENSIIKFKFSENAPVETFKISKIIYPTLTEMDFVPKLTLENTSNLETVEISLNDFDDFKRINLVSVEFTPYTLEEKLLNLLSESSTYDGKIRDKDKYISNLLEIIENEKTV